MRQTCTLEFSEAKRVPEAPAFSGQVMAGVRKIGKSQRQSRFGNPSGMATSAGGEPMLHVFQEDGALNTD